MFRCKAPEILNKTEGRSCGKVFIRRRTKRFLYLCNDACATKDEGNDADGRFSAAC